jgi:hypothetical protein
MVRTDERSSIVNRRELIQKLGGALAVAGVAAITTKEKAFAQNGNCGRVQHYTFTYSTYFYSQCSQQYIYATITTKEEVQVCTNADGSVTYKINDHFHGTGEGYDPYTGQFTGIQYVLNEQSHVRDVSGPYTPGGCYPVSDTYREHMLLISKGKALNEQVVYTDTFSVDSGCQYHFSYNFDTDCQG